MGKVNCCVFRRKVIMTAFCKEFDLSLQEMQKPFCHSCRSQSTQQSVLVSFLGLGTSCILFPELAWYTLC